MPCIILEEVLLIPAKEEKKLKKKWQLIPSSCCKPTDLKGHQQKNGEIGMSSLALLKVRVAYLQCGQSSP